MHLRTLGQLQITGVKFHREKPLLLVAYLAIEGKKPRRHLAELFWPEASDPMNSLAVALTKLRKLGVIYANEQEAGTEVQCDAQNLLKSIQNHDLTDLKNLYPGAFMEGATLTDLGEELEEWVFSTRERIALAVRSAYLDCAEQDSSKGNLKEAARWAELAYKPAGAPPPEVQDLMRLHRLLVAGQHPLASKVAEEAADYGVQLQTVGGMRENCIKQAIQFLDQGLPQKVLEVLKDLPADEEITLLRTKALERSGNYREAMRMFNTLPENPEHLGLKSALYWRLGQPEKAKAAAEEALLMGGESRAEALNTLGHLASSAGDYATAEKYFRRSSALWSTLPDRDRWIGALNNLAVSLVLQGQDVSIAFTEVLAAAHGNSRQYARVLMNYGWAHESTGNFTEAIKNFTESAHLAAEIGSLNTALRAWNNLGKVYHEQHDRQKAKFAYEQALSFARKAGEVLSAAFVLANISELEDSPVALEEAILLLEQAGHTEWANDYRETLKAFMERSGATSDNQS
ncbi:tetratricopeptide repeat protein [Deinococcus misasensis]|uniref:tetratricopeptide repeat protein n=1 Tax=Deinococcus misasensis TaxID=392413 RepID=UPI000556B871|nr:tetratricopeptide repeat protein [Deinococcus misasensis]